MPAATADHRAPFVHPVRVYWEDTDAGGIVFYANHLKFFERARTEWLRTLGVQQQALREQQGLLFVVHEARLRWHAPARLDDLLDITVEAAPPQRATLQLHQQALRQGLLLADADIRIACVDVAGLKPRRLPREILGRI